MRFGYDSELLARCPELVAGVVWASGLTNCVFSETVDHALTDAEARTRERFETPPEIAKSAPIAAWRQIYSRLGVKPNRYPCAAEALIRRVVEAGTLPRISAMVDICNAASLRYMIPVAPFDLAGEIGDCIVRTATGSETFLPIGAVNPDPVPAGEVIYVDGETRVLSRRWNWRQSDAGKITLQTASVLITTEAVHESGREAVEGVLKILTKLIPAVLGGSIQTDILDVDYPSSRNPFSTPASAHPAGEGEP